MMKVNIYNNKTNEWERVIETPSIPRKGDTIVFDEYNDNDVECEVVLVKFEVGRDNGVVSIDLYVEY